MKPNKPICNVATLIERIEATADASLAEIFDRRRLGIAIAAIINIIATTISSSIKLNPFCLVRVIN